MHVAVLFAYVRNVLMKTWVASAFFGGVVGVLFFVSYFGTYVLDPTNVNWLLNDNDLEQHYTGWVFFRESAWHLPLGMIDGLAYPFGIPVTFIDAIPLFAFIFKLLSPILPDTFQYFGLWGLMCFALQGALGALIARRFSKNILITTITSLLFVITPIFIGRMYIHTALAANWLILAGILTLLYYRNIQSRGSKFEVALWTVLMTLVVLIHPYYLPMAGVFFASYVILAHREAIRTVVLTIIPPVIMLAVFWIIGGFSLKGDSGAGGLDVYGFNLISPINPLGWSSILSSMPIGVDSGETHNYLGLGVMAACLLAFGLLLAMPPGKNWILGHVKNIRTWLIGALFIGLFILSLGTVVRYQAHVLFDLQDLPQRILEKWATFRSSARLFWPIYYLIITGAIAGILVTFNRTKNIIGALVLMLTVVGIQYMDVVKSPQGSSRHTLTDSYVEKTAAEKEVLKYAQSDKFNAKAAKKHLVYIDSMKPQDFFNLNEFAIREHLTMNTGYFSRAPQVSIGTLINDSKHKVSAGARIGGDTLFVVPYGSLDALRVPRDAYIMDRVADYVFIYDK